MLIRNISRAVIPAVTVLAFLIVPDSLADDLAGQRVTVSGVVRRVRVEPDAVVARMSTRGASVTLRTPLASERQMRTLIDAAVQVVGTWTVKDERNGEDSRALVVTRAADVTLVRPGAPDPFGLPPTTLRRLRVPHALEASLHRVRVQVVATAPKTDRTLYVTDGQDSVRVRTDHTDHVRIGDRLDLVAFPTRGSDGLLVLRDALYTVTSSGAPPVAVRVTPAQILTGAYANALVQLEGEVVRYRRGKSHYDIALKGGDVLFDGRIPSGTEVEDRIVVGSKVLVTGIALARFDAGGAVASFRVASHDSQDLSVVALPTWWTPTRALWLLGLCGAGLLVTMGSNVLLRRRLPLAERALSDSEARYQAIFENSPGGNYVTDARDKIVACNTTFTALLGFAGPLAAHGPSMRERYVTADERDQLLRRLTPASPMQTHEVAMLTTDQQLLRIQESVVAMFDGAGSLTRLHGFLLDVTERRLAEAALEQRDAELRQSQKMEAIGRLAGGIAHDFNNLLTAIIGFSELASAETSVPRIHEHLSEIRKATHSASALTRQLLAFSRKQPLAPEIVDLNGVIQRLDKLLRRTIGEDLELRYQLCDRSPAVRVDPGQLEQVLINLTVNARDAMPDGGTLTISTRCFGTRVLLAVSDTGHGIPQDVLPHIFEPFFTTKEQGKGTGLGLATVYGIVTRLGGVIRAKNNPAGGATFTIGLSVVGEHAAEGVEPATSDAQRGSETILLVEDEPSVRVLAERLLTRHGYRVLSATDVEEAVAIAEERSGEIDLLLTDVIMPRLSGPDLAASLTSMLPQLKVLYMSGYADHPRLRSDTTIVVAKPFTSAVLTSAVRAALDATSATIEPVP